MLLTDLSKDFCFIPLDLIIVKLKAYAPHKKWSFPLRISSVNVTKSAIFMQVCAHLLNTSIMENSILCAVLIPVTRHLIWTAAYSVHTQKNFFPLWRMQIFLHFFSFLFLFARLTISDISLNSLPFCQN